MVGVGNQAYHTERVAAAIVRAAHTQPRVAYVTRGDRLQAMASLLAPHLTDRLLGWAFRWE